LVHYSDFKVLDYYISKYIYNISIVII